MFFLSFLSFTSSLPSVYVCANNQPLFYQVQGSAFKKTVLTEAESFRFRRALYRIWLLSMCVYAVAMDDNDDGSDTNPDLGNADQALSRIVFLYIAARLKQFDTQELVQLVVVTNFLEALDDRQTYICVFANQRTPSTHLLVRQNFARFITFFQQLISSPITLSHHHTRTIVHCSTTRPMSDRKTMAYICPNLRARF
jgi:D-alanyl-lipoteichoic acid acyltransferase DltB (MBOAT superfamily)